MNGRTLTKKVLVNEDQIELDGSDTSNDDGNIQTPFDPSKIRIETKNTQMDALIKRIRNNEIKLNPDFQREAKIWNEQTQSRLIESMLIKIPLPAFYMDASDDNLWLVVDGLQRLSTVKRFVLDEELTLVGLEFLTNYNGKKYSDLPRNLQRRIEETDIVIYQIQPGTPHRVKFDIFKRINTGGAPLSAQEIRHALNQGKVIELLKELSESIEFLRATDDGVSNKRMDDRECVLRFLAFSITDAEKYNDDNFDLFLSEGMRAINKMTTEQVNVLKEKFNLSMNAASNLFGNDAFRKRYNKQDSRHPINKTLFEAWTVNLGKLTNSSVEKLISHKELLLEKFIEQMSDKDFEASISQGTGSINKVKLRFKRIGDIIEEVLAC